MSFFYRHTFASLASVVFVVFAALTLWGYNKDLNQILSQTTPETAPHSEIIAAFHNLPEYPSLDLLLARTLTANPIEKVAFAILISFKPEAICTPAYMYNAQFGTAKGLSKAAQKYFGVTEQNLSIGETLLLLELALDPQFPISHPQLALHKRDALLEQLYTQNILTQTQYHTERQKALALAADHRPMN